MVQYSVWRSTQRMVDVARSLLSPTLHHLCRSTLLQATSAMAAAFELGPATQCSSDVHDLWDMIGGVIKGTYWLISTPLAALDCTLVLHTLV